MKAYVPKIVMQIFLTLVLSVFALSALAGRCDNPKWSGSEECKPPVTDPVTLKVDVYFGDDGAGDPGNVECDYKDATSDLNKNYLCVRTSFTAVGSVICNSQVCDFAGTVEAPAFNFPPSLANLLAATSIRGTVIDPDLCFDATAPDEDRLTEVYYSTKEEEYQDDSGTTLTNVYEFTLRSPVNATPDAMWWAKVRAISTDMEDVPQKYGFHFGGLCNRDAGICPTLSDGNFDGDFEDGYTTAVFGSNTNKRNVPYQTCRCTVSSKPSCPENVDIEPRPMAIISISEI